MKIYAFHTTVTYNMPTKFEFNQIQHLDTVKGQKSASLNSTKPQNSCSFSGINNKKDLSIENCIISRT